MTLDEHHLLVRARRAARSIGTIFQKSVPVTTSHQLALLLLDDLTNYASESGDLLRHEIQLGILEALIPETVSETQARIARELVKTDIPQDRANPAL